MSSFPLRFASLSVAVSLFAIILTVFPADIFAGDDWKPVNPQELKMQTPIVDPKADAEVIFWEVRIDDKDLSGLAMRHYIRVKIFTERGREKYSKVDIPYTPNTKISGIIARVIKPDGTITEISKSDIFDREIVRKDKIKVKAKSFAVAGLEPGTIFEYQYKELVRNAIAEDMRMVFQHDVPIQSITYYFRPLANARTLSMNMPQSQFEKDKEGFYRATMKNVPAIKEEPFMPPIDEIRSWMLVYYSDQKTMSATDFWSRAGGVIVKRYGVKDTLKPGKDMKSAAEQITAGASTQEEKLRKLFDFCKTQIKNISYDPSLTDDQLEEIKPNKSAEDTYKNRQGRAGEINELFASLSAALGFETRLAFGGDRSEMFFDPRRAHESFIHFSAVAVKYPDGWRYYSPGDPFVPFGQLAWNESDTGVLLLGPKDFMTSTTPFTDINDSVEKRSGKFTLSEDGTLSGTVRIEYTGQLANDRKLDNYKISQNQREEDLKAEIRQFMSTAEISDISIENVTDPEKPFVYTFKITVPGYAQKTGRRMFLRPGFFEYGKPATFQTEDRTYSVFFHYPWSEIDDIEISLPKGFQLESPDSPAPIEDPGKISNQTIKILYDQSGHKLIYSRRFYFGNKGITLFPKDSYPAIKRLFDAFHAADSHSLTLRQQN